MTTAPDRATTDPGAPRGNVRVLFGAFGWPSGMLDVASWARRAGLADPVVFQVQPDDPCRLAADDCEALPAAGSPLVEKIIEMAPHVVGFRLEGDELELVGRCVRAVRLVSDAEIVLGGPTATSHPREVLDATGADYVFAGEAEEPFNRFLRLAHEPRSRDRAAEIPGLAFRHAGRIYHNTLPQDGYGRTVLDTGRVLSATDRHRLRNLVRPVADGDVLRANRLDWTLLEGFSGELDSLYFVGGRGCPGACTFCANMHGQQVRVKTARQLLEEIEAVDRLVAQRAVRVSRWKLFEHTDRAELASLAVSWAAVYDEDFLLDRRRAVEFFRLWDASPLKHRYRISLQTNPRSLLASDGSVREDLFEWIDRLKPMVQLGAESFHPELLARWRKRHDLDQLNRVLDALDRTRQDYTVFQLLTDFDTTPEELVETLRRLVLAALRHRRMRIASSPFTIPLYDCETRAELESRPPGADRVRHFADYLRPQPGWMDPLAAELADLADAQLQFALDLPHREAALHSAFEAVLRRIRDEHDQARGQAAKARAAGLLRQAESAMAQIQDVRFQAIDRPD